jgi:erythronate-4-phosphate dehydrogenase
MKIVADENIPLLEQYFGHVAELVVKPGRSIMREDVLNADVLLVRSVTKINSALLAGTTVKFVGSCTTGVDHVDTEWLDANGIQWAVAAGSNARSVVEYVIAVVASLKKESIFSEKKLRAGVIGVGTIGSQVAEALQLFGFDVICCDPPRAASDPQFLSRSLDDFVDLDLVTIHTPLCRGGDFSTYHMINEKFLQRQKKGCVLLNVGRGAVVDFSDLEEYGQHLYWCLDVWENEPLINFEILGLAEIATPHIAGYSVQSKQRAIDMIYHAAVKKQCVPPVTMPLFPFSEQVIEFSGNAVDWCDVVLKIFDPRQVTLQMKTDMIENGSDKTFDLLRKNFKDRYEFGFVTLRDLTVTALDKTLLQQLGLRFS